MLQPRILAMTTYVAMSSLQYVTTLLDKYNATCQFEPTDLLEYNSQFDGFYIVTICIA